MGEVLELGTDGTSALAARGERLGGFVCVARLADVSVEYVEGRANLDEAYYPDASADRYQKLFPEEFDQSSVSLTPAEDEETEPASVLREVPRVFPEIYLKRIREILNTRNASTPILRVGQLIQYAYEAGGNSEPYERLPRFAEHVALDINSWLTARLPGQPRASKKTKFDMVNSLMRNKHEYRYLLKETEGFEKKYEWLQNAERIAKLMGVASDEARFIPVAVRQILVEAQQSEPSDRQ